MSRQDEQEYRISLSSIPTIQRHNILHESLGNLVYSLQQTGFHKWGFVVYRCAYGDDALWQRYVDKMGEKVVAQLDRTYGRKELLQQYLHLTVIENEQTLGNASKSDVCARFTEWAFERSDERDGAGASHPFSYRLPRFAFCLYVDQKCLDSLKALEKFGPEGRGRMGPPVVAAIIDAGFDVAKSGMGNQLEVDGCPSNYVGWMYMEVDAIPGLYDTLHSSTLDERREYKRPPKVYPRMNFSIGS